MPVAILEELERCMLANIFFMNILHFLAEVADIFVEGFEQGFDVFLVGFGEWHSSDRVYLPGSRIFRASVWSVFPAPPLVIRAFY